MYSAKNKGTTVPSDLMAKEKLMGYVYEYLVHNGANKTADCFVKEMHFDSRQMNQMASLGDSPGFLFSWWSIFWDLYSSTPERRNLNPHSDEAKAFHDYNFVNGQQNNGQMYINGMQHNSNAPSPLGMPPNDGMPGGPGMPPGAPGFFPNSHMRPSPTQPVNQPSPHSQIMQNQQFMTPRYPNVPGPRGPNVRIPQEFNPPTGVQGGQPMMMPGNNMDPNRQGDDFVWQGPPPNMQARMAGPPQQRGVQMNPQMNNMGQFPPSSMRPPVNGQTPPNGQQMPPLNMPPGGGPPNGPGRQWPPNNNMNYNSPSPGNHYCPPVSNAGPGGPPGGPGTPGPGQIMPSPQGSAPYSPANHRMGTPNTGRDSSGPGEGMYPMMKMSNFVMNEPNLQPPNSSPLPNDPILESIKQSPGHIDQQNAEHNNIDYSIVPYQENDQNESAAILKIKESMQEETKRFFEQKDAPGELIDSNFYQ